MYNYIMKADNAVEEITKEKMIDTWIEKVNVISLGK